MDVADIALTIASLKIIRVFKNHDQYQGGFLLILSRCRSRSVEVFTKYVCYIDVFGDGCWSPFNHYCKHHQYRHQHHFSQLVNERTLWIPGEKIAHQDLMIKSK